MQSQAGSLGALTVADAQADKVDDPLKVFRWLEVCPLMSLQRLQIVNATMSAPHACARQALLGGQTVGHAGAGGQRAQGLEIGVMRDEGAAHLG